MGLLCSPQVTYKFIIGRNLRQLLWNWLVAWVSISTNVKSTHAICVLVSGYWGCKKWPRDHVWVVRQKHCKCQGNQTVFFLHFLQNLANCAENVTTPTHRQGKQNVCFKKQVPRWVYCLFASSTLLHCANIASKYSLKRIRCAGALRNTFAGSFVFCNIVHKFLY